MKRIQMLALVLAVTALAAWQPLQGPPAAPAELARFSLVLERSGSAWKAYCEAGCGWTEVGMDCGGCVIRIDSVGVVPAARGRAARGPFAFEVQPERAGWSVRGVTGTQWSELGWGCESSRCRGRFDETGVSAP